MGIFLSGIEEAGCVLLFIRGEWLFFMEYLLK